MKKKYSRLMSKTSRNYLLIFNRVMKTQKSDEKEINKIIANIKKIVGEFCDTIPEKEKKKYNEIIEIVENIKISESIPVKFNINDNIKFFIIIFSFKFYLKFISLIFLYRFLFPLIIIIDYEKIAKVFDIF